MNLIVQRGTVQEYLDTETCRRYFSVSEILHVLNPHAFHGMNLVKQSEALARGVAVHEWCALWLASTAGLSAQPAPLSDAWHGYAMSYAHWSQMYGVRPIRIEEPDCHPTEGYAGTPDQLVRYGKTNEPVLVDLKTGAPAPTHAIQVNAYAHLPLYRERRRLLVLYLQGDGTPAYERWLPRHTADWAVFLNALSIARWQMSH